MVRERPRHEGEARADAVMDSPAPPRAARDIREESTAAEEEDEEHRTEPREDEEADEAGPALLLLSPRLDSEEENARAVALAAQAEMTEHDMFYIRFL